VKPLFLNSNCILVLSLQFSGHGSIPNQDIFEQPSFSGGLQYLEVGALVWTRRLPTYALTDSSQRKWLRALQLLPVRRRPQIIRKPAKVYYLWAYHLQQLHLAQVTSVGRLQVVKVGNSVPTLMRILSDKSFFFSSSTKRWCQVHYNSYKSTGNVQIVSAVSDMEVYDIG